MSRDEAFRFPAWGRGYHGKGVQVLPGNVGFIHLCGHALKLYLLTFLSMPESLLVIIANSNLSRVSGFVEATVFGHSCSRITSRDFHILRYHLDNSGLSELMKNRTLHGKKMLLAELLRVWKCEHLLLLN